MAFRVRVFSAYANKEMLGFTPKSTKCIETISGGKESAPPPQQHGRGGSEGDSGPRRAKGNSLARLNRVNCFKLLSPRKANFLDAISEGHVR